MKKLIFILFTFLILTIATIAIYYSQKGNSNQTDVGSFWYNEHCDIEHSAYHHKFMYNDKLLIHITTLQSNDEPIYHYGTAIMKVDTLKLKVEEKDKFSYRWDNEIARKMHVSPFNLYFTSQVIPKYITVQFGSYGPIPLDSLKIRFAHDTLFQSSK